MSSVQIVFKKRADSFDYFGVYPVGENIGNYSREGIVEIDETHQIYHSFGEIIPAELPESPSLLVKQEYIEKLEELSEADEIIVDSNDFDFVWGYVVVDKICEG